MIAVLSVVGRAEAQVELDQFAGGWPIELAGDAAFYELALSAEQYRLAESLAQMAVLDARAETMPFYRPQVETPDPDELRTTLTASPIYRANSTSGNTELDIDSSELRARISIAEGDQEQRIVAFVVDARAVETPVTGLDFNWLRRERPFLVNVTIEHSEDLSRWQPVGRGAIGALAVDSTLVAHRHVEIRVATGGFYRVRWRRDSEDFLLDSVELLGQAETSGPPRLSERLAPMDPQPDSAPNNAIYFDAGGRLPVASVAASFNAENTWVEARISSASSLDGPWRESAPQHVFYRLTVGADELTSQAAQLGRIDARYWRFDVVDGARVPAFDLEIEYQAETLRFAAQGEAPYRLVAGTLLASVGPDPTLASLMRAVERQAVQIGSATLGPYQSLGGDAALVVPYAFPWRNLLLWSVLGIGVLVVAGMALGVARELYKPRSRGT
jgi:hypothetical protein